MRFLSSLIFLLFCTNAFAVCVPTKTVCTGGGCDYSTQKDALTYMAANCTSPSEPLEIKICSTSACSDTGTSGTDSTYFSGYGGLSTTSTNNLTIKAYGSARTSGIWDTGRYLLSTNDNFSGSTDYVVMDGWQLAKAALVGNSTSWTIKNCLIKTYTGGATNGTMTLINNIIFADTSVGVEFYGANLYAYNNTFYGFTTYGLWSEVGSITAKNNICVGSPSAGCFRGTFTAASTNNLSTDSSAPALNTYYRDKTITFVNSAGLDFHLASTDTDAIDKGADLSGTFTTDIDGTTRSGTWDIGADEFVSSGVSTHTTIMRNATLRNAIIR